MLERQEQILAMLEERRFVTAKTLSDELFVSLPTVRRDLSALAAKGLIVRNRGGARRLTTGHEHVPYAFREGFKMPEKKQLSRATATLIHDGDVIYVDDSTTFLPIVEYLCERKALTVVTNSIPLTVLLKKSGIVVHCLGGVPNDECQAFFGAHTQAAAENFNFDCALFSAAGINARGEIVDYTLDAVMLRRTVKRRAKQCVFVCDGEKFWKDAACSFSPLSEMDTVITNRALPDEWGVSAEKQLLVPTGL